MPNKKTLWNKSVFKCVPLYVFAMFDPSLLYILYIYLYVKSYLKIWDAYCNIAYVLGNVYKSKLFNGELKWISIQSHLDLVIFWRKKTVRKFYVWITINKISSINLGLRSPLFETLMFELCSYIGLKVWKVCFGNLKHSQRTLKRFDRRLTIFLEVNFDEIAIEHRVAVFSSNLN